jgi:hypothetical protein
VTGINDPEIDTNCRLCGGPAIYLQTGELLDVRAAYFECPDCGYVQTETPYWLDRAYAEAINESDTGIMVRNQSNARIALATMAMLGKLDGVLVDYAGGYGILVRMLRDYGINALWSDRYSQNIMARGFEHTIEKSDLVTAFEVFEHFVHPAEEMDELLAIAPNVLFSTEIITDPAPKQDEWWYYGSEHGQHIGFFRVKTLEKLARDRGKFLLSNGVSHHLITDRPINQVVWRVMIRINRIMPFLLRHKLTTKTWLDHTLKSGK